MKRIKLWLLGLAAALSLSVSACSQTPEASVKEHAGIRVSTSAGQQFNLTAVPAYSGQPYTAVNGNVPYFKDSEMTAESFESYSSLDGLGRCGAAYASLGTETMPTEKRGEIGSVKPSGWHTAKYDNVDGKYLYNRCHLIGYQLSAENANERNLITGTRYLNVEGMLPFENMVADYIKETGNHVMYRVTPVFEGNNLVASGVLMEGKSVEDDGEGILFCEYVYNVQPGIEIDYADGDSMLAPEGTASGNEEGTYILNVNSKKFHRPSCSSVDQMKEANKREFEGSRDELLLQGYEPCKRCTP